jgi:4-hydroxyacetophenone monooxygenase
MTKIDPSISTRHELLAASDDVIDDALMYADPMVLRALLYQLTGDPEVKSLPVKHQMVGFFMGSALVRDEDAAMLRRKAAQFLKSYRDAGAGPISIGPRERLVESMGLANGAPLPDDAIEMYTEELGLNPWSRSHQWRTTPTKKQLQDFTVTIIGAGMGGLNAALQLKRAGIPYTVIEKNAGVGGTWYENRYPGARVDSPSRSYTNIFGVDFGYPNPFCAWQENQKYFDWVADEFDLRKDITFNTEVHSLTWDEAAGMWEILMDGPEGRKVHRSRAVITAVGFLNRPNIPDIEGKSEFQGPSWHTARWPENFDTRGKRIAVIGTGCTGYQMIPELALEAGHVTVFQRTPQWLFPVPGYRSPFPAQVNWLDRNMPFHTNFMRFRMSYNSWFGKLTEIDPTYPDPHAPNAMNKEARDSAIAFLKSKLKDPKLVETMTPAFPVWAVRAVVVDPEYSVLDALQRDNVTLVTNGIKRINRTGIETEDGKQHDVDAIVFATGFHATEYLLPMKITGRDGMTTDKLWAEGGARAYLGCMMPGFPNLWSLYGPNTNGALQVTGFHELVLIYAMQCMEKLILEDNHAIDVKDDAYWRFNREQDALNARKVWADPRAAKTYYWSKHGRSITQSPYTAVEMWHFLRRPDFADFDVV